MLLHNWKDRGMCALTGANIRALLNNEIPFIRVKQFCSKLDCERLVRAAEAHEFGLYENVEPVIERIGCSVFEYAHSDIEDYFTASTQQTKLRDSIFANSCNPLQRIISTLSTVIENPVSIARNRIGETYFAGIIRRIEMGTELHIDYAPAEPLNWEVSTVVNQIIWTLHLQVGQTGTGETVIFNRQWREQDEQLKVSTYGYCERVVENCEYVRLMPQQGELILFNTRNYHSVSPSLGNHATIASAIGEKSNGDLILWS